MDIVPHGDEFAIGVKYLDAMRLSVSDVNIVVLVNDHVMRSDELARVDA
jgi:hypothetical protein